MQYFMRKYMNENMGDWSVYKIHNCKTLCVKYLTVGIIVAFPF